MWRGGLVVFLIMTIAATSLVAQFVSRPTGSGLPHSYGEVSGKSWRERVVPGVTFQVQRQNRGGLDINLFAGYRFSSRFTAGLGWNDRVGFRFRRHIGVSRRRGVYGPRSFIEYKLPRGFSLRGEVEIMNAYLPPVQGASAPGAVGSRKWVWGYFVGVKKSFALRYWVRGNLQLLYNLHDAVYKTSPYSDQLNLRFGFEFPLRGKTKSVP